MPIPNYLEISRTNNKLSTFDTMVGISHLGETPFINGFEAVQRSMVDMFTKGRLN